ncbi:MAG: hypothetical protein Q9227_006907 [Pyrenula ochraceoflavens]
MPLHLLGKKSWNVYNQDNIARVRRDEAEARAREEERDRLTQEIDSKRRLQLLKGVQPDVLDLEPQGAEDEDPGKRRKDLENRPRKRKRLAGEDDTERDIRYAIEDTTDRLAISTARQREKSDAPLTDSTGHFNLIPASDVQKLETNPEVDAEKAKKHRELEDQYTMRFSNAAGFKQSLDDPWYSQGRGTFKDTDVPSKDVWGNEDPSRRERDKARLNTNDPLAAMKKGVKQLRETEKQREAWNDERRKEIAALDEEHRSRRHHKRRRRRSLDSRHQVDALPDERRETHRYKRSRSVDGSDTENRRRPSYESASHKSRHRSHHRHRPHRLDR